MKTTNRYVYDGWLPLTDWSVDSVRKAIKTIGETLSVFIVRGSIRFKWEPKYPSPERFATLNTCSSEGQHFTELFAGLAKLGEKDRQAVYRSFGWLSQSLSLEDPAARLLFGLLAIESLVHHIESVKADSPFVILQPEKLGKAGRRKKREDCIKRKLDTADPNNYTQFVESAYFDCIASIKRKLQHCLELVFGKESNEIEKFFLDKEAYLKIRNDIAHGGVDTLDDEQRTLLIEKSEEVESLARAFLSKVLAKCVGISPVEENPSLSGTLLPDANVIANFPAYRGHTHMAILYG